MTSAARRIALVKLQGNRRARCGVFQDTRGGRAEGADGVVPLLNVANMRSWIVSASEPPRLRALRLCTRSREEGSGVRAGVPS